MTLPINSLANMEYMLYGGALGANPNCPSYLNGYKASNYNSYYNPYMQVYQNGMSYLPSNNTGISQQAMQNAYNASQQSQGYQKRQVSKNDIDTLAKYYEDSNSCVQEWSGLGTSALLIGAMENPQVFKHPLNSYRAACITNKVFDTSNSAIRALWEKNPELMQKAYGQMHAINRAAQPKFSVVQKWFQKPISEASRQELEKIMVDAIKSGDEKAILKAAETLKASRGMDGYLPSLWNKITGKKNLTPQERIAKKAADIDKAVNAPAAVKPGMTGLLKQGIKEGKTFALFGMLIDSPKIISAYKDGGFGSAMTQTLQTGIKSAADGVGWALGRAAGTAIGTKVGAAIGTAICPGLGTAVGAVIGFLGGAAGSILASKITHSLMPTDEATKLEAEKMKKTPEGNANLLSIVMQKAQAGEEVPPRVLASAQNVATALSA